MEYVILAGFVFINIELFYIAEILNNIHKTLINKK